VTEKGSAVVRKMRVAGVEEVLQGRRALGVGGCRRADAIRIRLFRASIGSEQACLRSGAPDYLGERLAANS